MPFFITSNGGSSLGMSRVIENNLVILSPRSEVEKDIDASEFLADLGQLTEIQINRKAALESCLCKWKIRKSQLFRQYVRTRNIIEKDGNTKYFHAEEKGNLQDQSEW